MYRGVLFCLSVESTALASQYNQIWVFLLFCCIFEFVMNIVVWWTCTCKWNIISVSLQLFLLPLCLNFGSLKLSCWILLCWKRSLYQPLLNVVLFWVEEIKLVLLFHCHHFYSVFFLQIVFWEFCWSRVLGLLLTPEIHLAAPQSMCFFFPWSLSAVNSMCFFFNLFFSINY